MGSAAACPPGSSRSGAPPPFAPAQRTKTPGRQRAPLRCVSSSSNDCCASGPGEFLTPHLLRGNPLLGLIGTPARLWEVLCPVGLGGAIPLADTPQTRWGGGDACLQLPHPGVGAVVPLTSSLWRTILHSHLSCFAKELIRVSQTSVHLFLASPQQGCLNQSGPGRTGGLAAGGFPS